MSDIIKQLLMYAIALTTFSFDPYSQAKLFVDWPVKKYYYFAIMDFISSYILECLQLKFSAKAAVSHKLNLVTAHV